jgi:uncharacterized protein YjbI with pentapeptide repeats
LCNYEGCERENYVDSKGNEWNYCIFHLPKGDLPEEAKEEMKKDKVDRKRLKELERFLALDEEEQKEIREDFKSVLEGYVEGIEKDIKSGEEGVYYDFIGFWFYDCDFEGYEFKADVDFRRAKFLGEIFFQNSTFLGNVNFKKATFLGFADFSEAKFSEDATFIDSEFYANFNGFFSKGTTFQRALFSEKADFYKAKFSGVANFYQANFSGDADFSEAKFFGDAKFENSIFSGDAYFQSSRFYAETIFNSSKFYSISIFNSSIFFKSTEFISSIFEKGAYFVGCEFKDELNFDISLFKGENIGEIDETLFQSAIFHSLASFQYVKFYSFANFINTIFHGEAMFDGSLFSDMASFEYAEFKDKGDFENTIFKNKLSFRSSSINSTLSFKNAQFIDSKFVDFSRIKLKEQGMIYLTDAFLDKIMIFQDINEDVNNDVKKLKLVMGGIRISEKGEIRFIKCDLSEVSFLQVSDMHRITFMGVKWPPAKDGKLEEAAKQGFLASKLMLSFLGIIFVLFILSLFLTLWIPNKIISTMFTATIYILSLIILFRHFDRKVEEIWDLERDAICDEIEGWNESLPYYWCPSCSSLLVGKNIQKCPICGFENINRVEKAEFYEYLMIAYEKLRENYEMNNRHVEAGDFYIGEMEARKKWLEYREKKSPKRTDVWHKQLIEIYRILSLYGESVFRPIFWLLSFSIVFAYVFYVFSNGLNIPLYDGIELYVPKMFFNRPIDLLTSVGYSLSTMYQNPPPEIPLIFALPERLLGLLFNALFILALNRKFRRKGRVS